jgi:hypothetical protein
MNRIDEPLLQSGISSGGTLRKVFVDAKLQGDSVNRNFRITAVDGTPRHTSCQSRTSTG